MRVLGYVLKTEQGHPHRWARFGAPGERGGVRWSPNVTTWWIATAAESRHRHALHIDVGNV